MDSLKITKSNKVGLRKSCFIIESCLFKSICMCIVNMHVSCQINYIFVIIMIKWTAYFSWLQITDCISAYVKFGNKFLVIIKWVVLQTDF